MKNIKDYLKDLGNDELFSLAKSIQGKEVTDELYDLLCCYQTQGGVFIALLNLQADILEEITSRYFNGCFLNNKNNEQ